MMAKMSTSKPVHVLINKYPDLEADVIEQVFLNNRCQIEATEKYLTMELGAVPKSMRVPGGRKNNSCASQGVHNSVAPKVTFSNGTSSDNSTMAKKPLTVEESDDEVIEINPRDQSVTPAAALGVTKWMTADSLRSQCSNNQRPLLSYYDLYKPIQDVTTLGVKRLVLLRGLPGSGKSTRAQAIQQQHGGAIFSADQYFVDNTDGSYHYQKELIGRAHLWNRTRAQNAASQGVSPIIIDNTNTMMKEMKPYIGIARHFGYIVEIEEMQTPWAMNPADLARKNIHGVDETRIRLMKSRYQNISKYDVMTAFCRMPSPNNFKHGRTINEETQCSVLHSLTDGPSLQNNEILISGSASNLWRPSAPSVVSNRCPNDCTPAVVVPKQPPKLKPVITKDQDHVARTPQDHKVQDWMTAQLSNLSVTAAEFQPTASTFLPPKTVLSTNQFRTHEEPANDDERTLLSIFPNQTLENVRNLLIGNNGDMDASIEVLCDLTDELHTEVSEASPQLKQVARPSTDQCCSSRTEALTVVPSLKSLALKVVDQSLSGSAMGPDALLIINSSMSLHEKSQMNSLGPNVKIENLDVEQTYIDILDSEDSDDDDENANNVTVIHNDVTVINNDVINSTLIVAAEDNAAENVSLNAPNLSSTLKHTNVELPAFSYRLPPELTSHLIDLFGTFPSWELKRKVKMDQFLLKAIYDAWRNTPYDDDQVELDVDHFSSVPETSYAQPRRQADENEQVSVIDLTSPVKPMPSNKANECTLIDISSSTVGSPATSERSIGTSPKAKRQKRTKGPRVDLASRLPSGQTSTKYGEGSGRGGVSLYEIMDEEERAEKSEEAQRQAFSMAAGIEKKATSGDTAANLLKGNTLRMLFPDIEEDVLTTVLQDLNYSLKDSVQILSMQFGEPSQERLTTAKTNPLWNDSQQVPGVSTSTMNPEPFVRATVNADRSFQTLVSPDYVDYRAESNMYRDLRQRELEKAMNATGADKAAKREHYARNAFEYGELMKEANQRAALLTLEQNKEARGGALDELDLHKLHVEEALVAVKNHLVELTHPKQKGKFNKLRIITGWGKNTVGPARIKPEVIKLLRKERLNFVMENRGSILVSLK